MSVFIALFLSSTSFLWYIDIHDQNQNMQTYYLHSQTDTMLITCALKPLYTLSQHLSSSSAIAVCDQIPCQTEFEGKNDFLNSFLKNRILVFSRL